MDVENPKRRRGAQVSRVRRRP